MRPVVFRLVLCVALFGLWMGYLGYLVLTRPSGDYDNCVELDSVRDADGKTVQELSLYGRDSYRLPAVPEHIAALGGGDDPRDPGAVLDLIQRHRLRLPGVPRLPAHGAAHRREIQAEDDGGRTPLGLPLHAADEPTTS